MHDYADRQLASKRAGPTSAQVIMLTGPGLRLAHASETYEVVEGRNRVFLLGELKMFIDG